jgi:hypothetical protein
VSLHEILGKGLAGFELCRRSRRAEHGYPHGPQAIREPIGQRILRADYHQPNRLTLAESDDRLAIARADLGKAGRTALHTRTARRGQHTTYAGALGDLPRQCVLTPTRANHEYVHENSSHTSLLPSACFNRGPRRSQSTPQLE